MELNLVCFDAGTRMLRYGGTVQGPWKAERGPRSVLHENYKDSSIENEDSSMENGDFSIVNEGSSMGNDDYSTEK